MKFNDVNALINGGALAASSSQLNINAAYAITKFKRALKHAFEEWKEKFDSYPAEVGIDDAQGFDARRAELTTKIKEGGLSNAEVKELDKMNEKYNRVIELRNKLGDDDVKIECEPLSWSEWFTFKENNKNIQMNGYATFEVMELTLEGVLWNAPAE